MSAKLLRGAALVVTDRRWAAPLSAVALGFGLFAGVAIGPGAAGTFATGAAQIIEIPGLVASADSGGDGEGEDPSQAASGGGGGSGGGEGSAGAEPAIASFAPGEFESETAGAGDLSQPKEPAGEPDEESEPEEQTLTGVVVHVNPAAGSYTVAESSGTLDVLHAGKTPRPGTVVSVPSRLLANGTFAEAGARIRSGTRDRAKFTGIVTYLDPTPAAPAYSVSKRGVSVLVHVHPDPTGAAPALPALGAYAKVAVDIEKAPTPTPPAETTPAAPSEPAPTVPAPTVEPAPAPPACAPDPSQPPPPAIQPRAILWQRQVSAEGAPFTSSDFAGIVGAVCADAGKLLISADDIRESGHDLLFTVPATIDTTKLEVGQSVAAFAKIGADGFLELTGLASDERTKGADDEAATQGDLVPTKLK